MDLFLLYINDVCCYVFHDLEPALKKVQAIRREEFTIRQRIDRIRYDPITGQVITSSILHSSLP